MKRFCHWLLGLVIASTTFYGSEVKPFPQNRIDDFYANQARHYLNSKGPLPKILPEFPGLDGGSWGYWGQNPEADNYDYRLNEVDTGILLSQVTQHFGKKTLRAHCIKIPDEERQISALFDSGKLTFTDVWEGGFVEWQARRYGITSGVKAKGKQILNLQDSMWNVPYETPKRYLGHYRNGNKVIFSYSIGKARILDHLAEASGSMVRILEIRGQLPENSELKLTKNFALRPKDLRPGIYHIDYEQKDYERLNVPFLGLLITGGPAQWADKTVVTKGKRGQDTPYSIDTLTVPYRDDNPFKSPMRLSGLDILRDGRIAVCNLMGDVWIVEGVGKDLKRLKWKRFAAGLHNSAGLVVRGDKIHVIGRDQLTRLHDLNDDGEADFYECVTDDFPIGTGNGWALTLHHDFKGNFYWFTRASGFDVTKYNFRDKEPPQSIGNGLRGTNGTGVSPHGSIVFATVQDGNNAPASAIFEVGDGSYHGFKGQKPERGPNGYDLPMCFIPRGVDNSSGDLTFVPRDRRFGPLAGHILGTSFGYCSNYVVLREKIGDHVQGGVVPLKGQFLSGAHRARFNRRDGCFYVVGSDGWQSYAKENGSLQRVRYTGGKLILPRSVQTHANGLLLKYNCPLQADSSKAFAQQWNYLFANAYGSAEYSVRHPGERGHDPLFVKKIHLVENRRALFVEIPEIEPAMTLHLYLEAKDFQDTPFTTDLYYSPLRLREPYSNFPSERKTAVLEEPQFPAQGDFPEDPRLMAQDRLGRTLSNTQKISVKAVAGLKFEPTQLTIEAGKRTALTFINSDPSMAHNLVLLHPDSLKKVGEGSMKLAASPEGAAKHFTIEDPGVLGLTPILQPGGKYTLYFDAPEEPGEYPYICTFPGHWLVTRGVLEVN